MNKTERKAWRQGVMDTLEYFKKNFTLFILDIKESISEEELERVMKYGSKSR